MPSTAGEIAKKPKSYQRTTLNTRVTRLSANSVTPVTTANSGYARAVCKGAFFLPRP